MKLKISKDISLPLDIVTQTIAILAKRRAGKSYTMRKLVEQLLIAHQQVVLVDPKGDQWGIRSAADGKRPGFPIVILGGEHGDAPLEASGGEVVAKLVVQERVSVLLDLSAFRKHEVATFMTAFLENLYRLKAQEAYRTPVMLVIDEADAIAPQKPQKGEERMLGAAEDIVRRGGQRGIGCALITQRSAVLNKNVLTQAQMLIVLRTIAPQDLAAMKAWVDVHGTAEEGQELMDSLPSLPIGDAWFWSPGWPTAEGIFQRSHVLPIETFDSGATPKPGEKPVVPKNLADVDLEALKKQMAATIEKAKNDDPKLLRKRIAELEKEKGKTSAADPKQIERAAEEAIKKRDKEWEVKSKGAQDEIKNLRGRLSKISAIIGLTEPLSTIKSPKLELPPQRFEKDARPYLPPPSEGFYSKSPASLEAHDDTAGITGPEQKTLDGIAWMNALGVGQPEQTLVATLAGYSVYSSSFIKALSQLRTKGLIESQGRTLWLTPAGAQVAHSPQDEPSMNQLHVKLINKLDGPSAKIMSALLGMAGREMSDDELAAAAEYSPLSSSYIKAKSVLRGKDLMESEGKLHHAREILFP